MYNYLQLIICFVLGIITSDAQNKTLSDFIPEGSVVFKKYNGGLKIMAYVDTKIRRFSTTCYS